MKDKKLLSMMIITGIVVIIFIIIMVVIAGFSGKRLSYEKVEEKMKNAAVKYYQSRETELPQQNGESVTVSATTLTESGQMKALEKMVPKDSVCTGSVVVTKNGERYLYSPKLDCGSSYSSKRLVDVLTAQENIVIEGDGLYAKENGYIYKGENVNNLVRLGETLWAILDIDSDGYMRLINISGNDKQVNVWDDRYNVEEDFQVGINDFSVSRIKDLLVSFEDNELFLSEESKTYVASRPWCIGKRSEKNLGINYTEECEVMSEPQMFGLPYVSDVYAASVDSNCRNIGDNSCMNYNYISKYAIATWSITGVAESTSKSYYVVPGASVALKNSDTKGVIPTIYLSNNVMYSSGVGTIEEPYIVVPAKK